MSEFKQRKRDEIHPYKMFWQYEHSYATRITKEMIHCPSMQGVTLYLKKCETWRSIRQCENVIIRAHMSKQIENKMSGR